jgi:hypothetical protein
MAFSELQVALAGAGAAVVAMVWGYNEWQERKHRRNAERIFKGGQGDALLDGETVEAAPVADTVRREPGERLEPLAGVQTRSTTAARVRRSGGRLHPVFRGK